jgi:hypothetical protein
MQANTITLPVDVLNNGTPSNKVFTRFEEVLNRSTYIGPGHTQVARYLMQLYRAFAKRTGNFLGVSKSEVKITKDFTVLGVDGTNQVAPAIADASFSIPVGLTAAQMLELRQDLVAALDHAFMVSLQENLEI